MKKIISLLLVLIVLISVITPPKTASALEEYDGLLASEQNFMDALEDRADKAMHILSQWRSLVATTTDTITTNPEYINALPLVKNQVTDMLYPRGCTFGNTVETMREIGQLWEQEVCQKLIYLVDKYKEMAEQPDAASVTYGLILINATVDQTEATVTIIMEAAREYASELAAIRKLSAGQTEKETSEEEEPQVKEEPGAGTQAEDAADWLKELAEAAGITEGGTTKGGSSPPVKEEPEEVKEEPKQPVVVERDTDESSDDWCFIATAAYGTSSAQEIDVLRNFRDEFLRDSWLGNQFITTYYKYSPPLADFISEREQLRTFVREVIIDPIVIVVEYTTEWWE